MSVPSDISAIIFDLDGTLLNTLEEIAAAGNAALARHGLPEHSIDAYRQFVGGGAKKLAWRILPEEKRTEATYEAVCSTLYEEYNRVLNTIARPYPHVMDALAQYHAAKIPMAVLSNKPDVLTKVAVKTLLPNAPFIAVQGGCPEFPLKPEPASALALAKTLQTPPERIMFVGDSDVDMHTANNAGMFAVGAGWGFRGAEELAQAGAKVILKDPSELIGLFSRQ